MKAAEIKDVRIGDIPVARIMLGDRVVFERKYLSIFPDMVWIVDDNPPVVDVKSNTEWEVN